MGRGREVDGMVGEGDGVGWDRGRRLGWDGTEGEWDGWEGKGVEWEGYGLGWDGREGDGWEGRGRGLVGREGEWRWMAWEGVGLD